MSKLKTKKQQDSSIFLQGGALALLIACALPSFDLLNSLGALFAYQIFNFVGGASLAFGGFLRKDNFLKIFGIIWCALALLSLFKSYTFLQYL